jgi:hypothetical protein
MNLTSDNSNKLKEEAWINLQLKFGSCVVSSFLEKARAS